MDFTTTKVAVRTLARDKVYTLVNVAGLALALACCLFLTTYLFDQLTYDRSHVNHERIFRVVNEYDVNGRAQRFTYTSPMLGPMLAEDSADVRVYVRFVPAMRSFVGSGDVGDYWSDVYTADASVFDVFTHEVLYGDPTTALVEPASVAVSRTLAERYFGNRNPIGETLTVNGNDRQIDLVFEDLPGNTHLRYDLLESMSSLPTYVGDVERRQALFFANGYTYLLLPANYVPEAFMDVSRAFFERHMREIGDGRGVRWQAWLQPLTDIHLYSDVPFDLPTGNRYYVFGIATVALLTLLVACFNYVNLATARAAERVREISTRKILGSSRRSLIAQFLLESTALTLVAVVLAVILAVLATAYTPIGTWLGATPSFGVTQVLVLLSASAVLAAVVGLGAGLYPAFFLSSFAPVSAFMGKAHGGGRSAGLRETLVFVQFVASIAVVAGTLLMVSQLRYLAELNLGFEPENRIVVTLRGIDTIGASGAIRAELLRHPRVLGVSWAGSMMGGNFGTNVIRPETDDGVIEPTAVGIVGVGPDFGPVMGLTLAAGRYPRDDDGSVASAESTQSREFVVNETLVRMLRWTDALGKEIEVQEGPGAGRGVVVGVVKDFNFRSAHNEIGPFVFFSQRDNFAQVPAEYRGRGDRYLVLNVAGTGVQGTIDDVRATLAKFDAERPLVWQFLDERLERLYGEDQRLMRLISTLAGVCIAIACLGLFGLASFTATRRTREIAVRKVLGACTAEIIRLLSHRVLWLVVGAGAVGSIAAYVVISLWLQTFAFRTPINPVLFLAATLAALAVAYLTVALQSTKAARAHPARALSHE